MKTKDEILTEFANDNSYEGWGELMFDSHDVSQIVDTKEVMELYSNQQLTEYKRKLKEAIPKNEEWAYMPDLLTLIDAIEV